jgi:hypothetical protein
MPTICGDGWAPYESLYRANTRPCREASIRRGHHHLDQPVHLPSGEHQRLIEACVEMVGCDFMQQYLERL